MDPTISILVPTARASLGSLIGLETTHLYLPCFQSLEQQTCKDFELVIGDCLAPYRNLTEELKALGDWSFPWRVVPVINGFWQKQKLWSLQFAFNVCAVYSNGQNLMFSGDAIEFPPTLVEQAVSYIKQGYQPLPMFIYKLGNRIRRINDPIEDWSSGKVMQYEVNKNNEQLFGKSEMVRDSRFQFVEEAGGILKGPEVSWSWTYGNTCVSRDLFLDLNGYDENFDGEKSLGDSELGSRLELIGEWNPALDVNMYTFEYSHTQCNDKALDNIYMKSIRSNYDLLYALRNRRQVRANCYKLTEAEYDAILNQSKYCPRYTEADPEYKYQQLWKANPPNRNYRRYWEARRKKEGHATT